ncbi:MAG: sensor histidine kinase [Sphingobium sp.]
MNQGKALQFITTLIVIGVAFVSAALAEANALQLGILLGMGGLLIFVMWDRHIAPPPPAAIATPTTPAPDLLELPGFRHVVEGMAEPVLLVQRGKVALANAGALSLLGKHIIGEDVRIAIRHPAAAERLTSGETLTVPVKLDIVGLGARSQRWAMQIIPIDAAGGQQRLLVHLSDQSGAYAAERVRGDFVANASHELRTPLAAILGFVETLQDPKAGGDAQTRNRFLSILEKEARRMQQLVDDLMSLSRIEADKYRLPTTMIDMPALVDEVLASCRQNLGDRGGDIIANITNELPPAQGDRTQIAQLLHNLVSNSAKYGRAGTPIEVRLEAAPPSMLRLVVADQGEGISSEHLPRLTERFYRVDSGRSRAIGGTGLGLAIVKHIVERHRGRLDIASSVGKGTTVSVLLPQGEATASEMTAEEAPGPATLS